MKRGLLPAALLAGATLWLYLPVAGFEFVNFDDDKYVQQNPQVTGGLGWRGVRWAFSSAGYEGNWHPLTWLSHQLDVSLFGVRPGPHHLTSLALHAASAVLLFGLLLRLTGALWRSALVAAVFALHPLHVESVAWVAERKDVLSTFFWMLALGAYLHYVAKANRRRYALVFAFFALGLLAKPMVMTLPLLLLLLDYWPLGRFRPASAPGAAAPGRPGAAVWPLMREKLPLLALSLASGFVSLMAQGAAVQPLEAYPFATRAANAVVACAVYVGKALWPARLAIFYPYPEDGPGALPVLGGALLLIATTVIVLLLARRRPCLGLGWCWFLVTLFPAIGLVQVGKQAMADRYTYVPLIGLAVMAAWGAAGLPADGARSRRRRALLAGAGVLALALMARRQIGHWRDSESVMGHAVAVTRDNWLARHNLGVAYLAQGRLPEAVAQLEAALAIKPGYATAHLNLGSAYAALGRPGDAEREYRRAIALRPDEAQGYNNLGKLRLDQGRAQEAYHWIGQALERDPGSAEAHYNAGVALAALGRREEAIAEYRAAARLRPDFLEPHLNLGNLLDDLGRVPEAIAEYRRAMALNPADPLLRFNLAVTLERGGAREEAIGHYREALRLDPAFAAARLRLEAALRRR